MQRETDEDTTVYNVVVNHEEQYSIWPSHRELPAGWKEAGKSGIKAECLEYINEVWTDMRPLSLRKKMEEDAARQPAAGTAEGNGEAVENEPRPDDLIERLCRGEHPVVVSIRPEPNIERLKECLERKYIHIKFTGTQGGTELGVRLDDERSDLGRADFEKGTGNIQLVGGLTLNYVPVHCIAEIDIATFEGSGHLELAAENSEVTVSAEA